MMPVQWASSLVDDAGRVVDSLGRDDLARVVSTDKLY
jgi:hypothetical protein